MIVRVYLGLDGTTPTHIENRVCAINELGAELMSLFLFHDRKPLYVLFQRGESSSECVVVITKKDRRKLRE